MFSEAAFGLEEVLQRPRPKYCAKEMAFTWTEKLEEKSHFLHRISSLTYWCGRHGWSWRVSDTILPRGQRRRAHISQLPQLTCIWMSGPSGLGNQTNIGQVLQPTCWWKSGGDPVCAYIYRRGGICPDGIKLDTTGLYSTLQSWYWIGLKHRNRDTSTLLMAWAKSRVRIGLYYTYTLRLILDRAAFSAVSQECFLKANLWELKKLLGLTLNKLGKIQTDVTIYSFPFLLKIFIIWNFGLRERRPPVYLQLILS